MWTAKCDFNKEYKFPLFKFRHRKLLLFSSYEIVVGKNVRQQLNKTVVYKFYLTVHRFNARVQSPDRCF